jgi:integrase
LLTVQTGLRVSELISLTCQDVVLGTGAHVHSLGKGRKHRCTPLRPETVKMLEAWMRDRAVIALWLGHESVETTQIYLHADMKLKEKALSRPPPLGVKPGRYRPDDQLLAFLESL